MTPVTSSAAPLLPVAQEKDWDDAIDGKGGELAQDYEQEQDGAFFSSIGDGSPPDDASVVWLDDASAGGSVPEMVASPVDGFSGVRAGDVAVMTRDVVPGAINVSGVNVTAGTAGSITPVAVASATVGALGLSRAGAPDMNATSGASGSADVAALNAAVECTMGSAGEGPLVAQLAPAEAPNNLTTAAATATARASPRLNSPLTALESISFILRAAFRVRSKRDESIFPFIGIAYVVAKLSFMAAGMDAVSSRVLYATIVELFSTPVNALKFMETTFQVTSNGLHLGGRLKKSRHVSGQPSLFRAADFNAFFNPQGKSTQWLSRALCLREAITFRPGASHGPGGLTRLELDSLAMRLLSQASANAAASAGCRVHYCKAADNSMAVSEVIFTWDFQLGIDDRINTMLRTLRPILLKSPPQPLTQASSSVDPVTPTSAAAETDAGAPAGGTSRPPTATSPVPAADLSAGSQPVLRTSQPLPTQLAAVSAAARERATAAPTVTEPAGGHADSHGLVGSCGGSSAPAGHTSAAAVASSAAGAAGIAKRTSSAKDRALAKLKGFSSGNGKKATPPSGKGKAKKQRMSRAGTGACLCGSDGAASGGASWIVAEVRRAGQDVLLGMAVGVQLSWATDAMIGGRLDLSYCLSHVSTLSDSCAHQYVLNVDQTDERTPSGATSTRCLVSQLPTVQTNYMSLDFASVVERQCAASCASSAASRPPVISCAVNALDNECKGHGGPAAAGPANEGSLEALPEARQDAALTGMSGSPMSRNVARDTARPTVESNDLLKMVVVDAPLGASPLALTISFRSPTVLSPEHGSASRTPGRLILFFPTNTSASKVTNRC